MVYVSPFGLHCCVVCVCWRKGDLLWCQSIPGSCAAQDTRANPDWELACCSTGRPTQGGKGVVYLALDTILILGSYRRGVRCPEEMRECFGVRPWEVHFNHLLPCCLVPTSFHIHLHRYHVMGSFVGVTLAGRGAVLIYCHMQVCLPSVVAFFTVVNSSASECDCGGVPPISQGSLCSERDLPLFGIVGNRGQPLAE